MTTLAAALAVVAVTWVPGMALLAWLDRDLSPLRWLAYAPAISLALVLSWSRILAWVGVGAEPWPVLAPLLIAAMAGLVSPRGWAAAQGVWSTARRIPGEAALLAAAVAATVALWARSTPFAEVPPNFDAMNHGFFVARIAATGSVEPASALVSDIPSGVSFYEYYPLALHAVLAQVAQALGVTAADVLNVVPLVFAGIALPLGTAALVRRVFPGAAYAAPLAALLTGAIALFPYKPIAWGGLALIAGMSLVPALADALVGLGDGRLRWGRVVSVGIASAGVFETHNPEAVSAVVIAGLLVLFTGPQGGWARRVLTWIGRAALSGMVALVVLVPALVQLRAEFGDRQGFDDSPDQPVMGVLGQVLTLTYNSDTLQPAIVALGMCGVVVALWRQQGLGLLAGWVAFAGLTVAAASFDGTPLQLATLPWYRQAERLGYHLAFFVAMFGGVALAALALWLGRVVGSFGREHGERFTSWAAAAASAALGALVVVSQWPTVGGQVTRWYSSFSTVTPSDRSAFDFLAANTAAEDRVLRQEADGSQWMYALGGANPAFAVVPPRDEVDDDPTIEAISWLVANLASIDADPRVAEELDRLSVRYVYADASLITGGAASWDPAQLEATQGLEVAFNDGDSWVFAPTGPSTP